jgi:hypothetical protein
MTSEAQKAANRRNACNSTGPRTTEGKGKSSRNSRRHGLRASIFKDPSWSAHVDRIAKTFSPKDADPTVREKIRTMAGTMMDIIRIEETRTSLWNMILHEYGPDDSASERGPSEREAIACLAILPRLITLNRYELQAQSRWKRALTALR